MATGQISKSRSDDIISSAKSFLFEPVTLLLSDKLRVDCTIVCSNNRWLLPAFSIMRCLLIIFEKLLWIWAVFFLHIFSLTLVLHNLCDRNEDTKASERENFKFQYPFMMVALLIVSYTRLVHWIYFSISGMMTRKSFSNWINLLECAGARWWNVSLQNCANAEIENDLKFECKIVKPSNRATFLSFCRSSATANSASMQIFIVDCALFFA